MQPATLLNTRPKAQASELAAALEEAGVDSLSCPAIEIQPILLAKETLPSLADFDLLFFISANAVWQLVEQWQQTFGTSLVVPKTIRCYAIGQATQNAMCAAGIPASTTQGPFDSEQLLAELGSQLASKKCLIVKGEGGLDTLSKGLVEKGAKVTRWDCYRRVPAAFCRQAWQDFRQAERPIVLASSLQTWENLVANVKTHAGEAELAWLFQQDCIVFSGRIKDALIRQHWQGRINVVPIQTNQGIIESIKQLLNMR